MARVVAFNQWNDVHVDCSVSFRVERAIGARDLSVRVRSNGVSLMGCGLGAVATGSAFPLRYPGRFGFIEIGAGSSFGRAATILAARPP